MADFNSTINVVGLRPGAYAETFFETLATFLPDDVRVPLIVGTGDDVWRLNKELIRFGHTDVFKEDLSSQIDGSKSTFVIPNTPVIVISDVGLPEVTNDAVHIKVYVDDKEQSVLTLDGTTGSFRIATVPAVGQKLEVSYSWDVRDTKITEDLSAQADGQTSVLYVSNLFIVDGTNRGFVLETSSSPAVVVTINGTEVSVANIDGYKGQITLDIPESSLPNADNGDTILVTYYYAVPRNYDELPERNVEAITSVYRSANTAPFKFGIDFVTDNNKVIWGDSVFTETDVVSLDSTSELANSVSATVYEHTMYGEPVSAARLFEGNDVLETYRTIVDGSGNNIPTNDPSDVTVITKDTVDGTENEVIQLYGEGKRIKYADTIDVVGEVVADVKPYDGAIDASETNVLTTGASITSEMGITSMYPNTEITDTNSGSSIVSSMSFYPSFTGSVLYMKRSLTNTGSSALTGINTGVKIKDISSAAIYSVSYQVGSVVDYDDASWTASAAAIASGDDFIYPLNEGVTIAAGATHDVFIKIVFDNDGVEVNGPAFVTYKYSDINTGEFTVKIVDAAAKTYNIYDANNRIVLYAELEEGTGAGINVNFPNNTVDIRCTPGRSEKGEYFITFISPDYYKVSFVKDGTSALIEVENTATGGYTWSLGSTFWDSDRGVMWTIMDDGVDLFEAGDTVEIMVKGGDGEERVASNNPVWDIPGVFLLMNDAVFDGVSDDDSMTLKVYNIAENVITPDSPYFVDYDVDKGTDYTRGIVLSQTDYIDGQLTNIIGVESLNNTAVLGAKACFEQGAPYVIVQQIRRNETSGDPTKSEFDEALSVFLSGFDDDRTRPYYIVPMSTDRTVLNSWKNAVDVLSTGQEGRPCVLIQAFSNSLTYQEVDQSIQNIANYRVIPIYPCDGVIDYTDSRGNTYELPVPPAVIAAEYAGMRSAVSVSASVINRPFVYIKKVQTREDDSVLGWMVARGCTTVLNENNVAKIFDESTSYSSNLLQKEPNIIFSSDWVRTGLVSYLNRPQFVPVKNLGDNSDLQAAVTTYLSRQVSDSIIRDKRNIKVMNNPNDPRIADISFEIMPIWTRKWIRIAITVVR